MDIQPISVRGRHGFTIWGRLCLYPVVFGVIFLLGLGLGRSIGFHESDQPDGLDQRLWSRVVEVRGEHPGLTRFFLGITRLGDGSVANPIILAVTLGLLIWGWRFPGRIGRWYGLFFLGAMLGGQLLTIALKTYFQRERPLELHRLVLEDSSSFPSGHSLNTMVFSVVLTMLLVRALRDRPAWISATMAVIFLVLAILMGASRIWLGVHYLSDVLGGFVLGLGWALAVGFIHFRPA